MELGRDGDCSGRESKRSLGMRDSGLGCSGTAFRFLALAVWLSNIDIKCGCMGGLTWSVMVVFCSSCAMSTGVDTVT